MKNSIKVERAKKNMTQAELAKRIQVSRQTINAMELASIFETTVDEIFTIEETDW
jgi:putative transcriptional regulator